MACAIDEASKAFHKGEVPIGAIIVDEESDKIISRGHNIKENSNDPTAHAEILAIKQACNLVGDWRLSGYTLYVTKEPCIMCSGAILNSRLSRVVFGCKDSKGGAVESLYNLLNDSRLNHRVEVVSGVLEEVSVELLKSFFNNLR